jgi:GDP-mannose 6-dehydrogenase
MKVSVFGLGYVGCVSAACLARQGHDVLGVDINAAKVDTVGRGESPIVEPGLADLVAATVEAGRLAATTDGAAAVARTDVSLVCVGTPGHSSGRLDTSYLERVSSEIGAALRAKSTPHLVVIRSTVLPGTLEEIVIPALEQASGRTRGDGLLQICANPEFLREGTSIQDFFEPPFTVIGGADDVAAAQLAELYDGVNGPVFHLDIRAAEMVKYACNAFHGLKVAFANEIGNICKSVGVDSHRVMDVFCADTKLNISPAYLKPGFAFGGSCLPKDLRALVHRARHLDVEVPVLAATLDSNRRQVERATNMVLAAGNRRIGILGLSFKDGTDDLRESPMVMLVESLIGKGMDVSIYDRNVSRSGLIGANRAYLEETIPHIWSLMRDTVEEVTSAAETLVVGSRSSEIRGVRERNGQILIDLVRLQDDRTTNNAGYIGICW